MKLLNDEELFPNHLYTYEMLKKVNRKDNENKKVIVNIKNITYGIIKRSDEILNYYSSIKHIKNNL